MKIGVFDSGIGGLSVLYKLINNYPLENYYYLGDNGNAPYGDKNKEQLKELVDKDVNSLLDCGVENIVIACNTASTTLFDYLQRKYSGVNFYPVCPKINFNLLNKGVCHLFCTERTAKNIALRYGTIKNLKIIPCRGLVEEIERYKMNFLTYLVEKYIPENFNNVNQVVLGCTHYELIKNCFCAYYPNAFIDDSLGFSLPISQYNGTFDKKGLTFIGDFKEENSKVFYEYIKKITFFGKKLPKGVDSGNFV